MFSVFIYMEDDLTEETLMNENYSGLLKHTRADGRRDHWVERLCWMTGRTSLGLNDCCR